MWVLVTVLGFAAEMLVIVALGRSVTRRFEEAAGAMGEMPPVADAEPAPAALDAIVPAPVSPVARRGAPVARR